MLESGLIVVTGKGGVGKSTVAAAVAARLAQAGLSVVILETDPRESIHRLLDCRPSGGEMVEVSGGLRLQNLSPRRAIDELVRRRVPLRAVARLVLASPIYASFAEGCPGLKEIAVLARTSWLLEGDRKTKAADVVVLDAPATGHGISLLEAPRLVSEAIGSGPAARTAEEVAEIVADERRSAFVVVTQAEEMPVTEALELRQQLRERFAREPALLVVNALYPPVIGVEERDDPAFLLWRERRRLNEAELERLAGSWPGLRVELPLLPSPVGPQLLEELGARLEPAVVGA